MLNPIAAKKLSRLLADPAGQQILWRVVLPPGRTTSIYQKSFFPGVTLGRRPQKLLIFTESARNCHLPSGWLW